MRTVSSRKTAIAPPEYASDHPEDAVDRPEDAADRSEDVADQPEYALDRLENAGDRAGIGRNQAGNAADRPENALNRLGNAEDRPGIGGNQAGNPADRPEKALDRPGNAADRPGNALDRPGNAKDRSGIGGNQSEDAAVRPEDAADRAEYGVIERGTREIDWRTPMFDRRKQEIDRSTEMTGAVKNAPASRIVLKIIRNAAAASSGLTAVNTDLHHRLDCRPSSGWAPERDSFIANQLMLRTLFIILLATHGFIHLIGFARAFRLAAIPSLSKDITCPTGLLWLAAALLFVLSSVLFAAQRPEWWMTAFPALILSQVLVFSSWKDAKWATAMNIALLVVAVAGMAMWRFERSYLEDVRVRLRRTGSIQPAVITEKDLEQLPAPVRRYLIYSGAAGKPAVKNMKAEFKGRMRGRHGNWFPFTSAQYNFYDSPTRLFFMKGRMYGFTVPGYHAYHDNEASMQIRLFGIYPVAAFSGDMLHQAETVTIFNDMCLLAPGSLMDKRIGWQSINDSSVRAVFTNKGVSISAILIFNARDQLVNFISDDRYDVGEMRKYRFSTPVSEYRAIGGYNLMSRAEAIWHYPEGPFVYGEFQLKDIQYNTGELSD